MSQVYSQRPSRIFGIRNNPWLAYQFDEAVLLFGQTVDSLMNERTQDGARRHTLEGILTGKAQVIIGTAEMLIALTGEFVD